MQNVVKIFIDLIFLVTDCFLPMIYSGTTEAADGEEQKLTGAQILLQVAFHTVAQDDPGAAYKLFSLFCCFIVYVFAVIEQLGK